MAVCCSGLTVITFSTNAQTLRSEDIKALMIKDWERAKTYTIEYLNKMPANKYSYKPVDSIRSFAQQMLHLATGSIFLTHTATNLPAPSWVRQFLEKSVSAQQRDSVMFYVTASYDYAINAVKSSDVTKWGQKVTVYNMEATRFEFLNKAFEHQSHHRGQTAIYIRLVGIRPPDEKLF